MAADGTDRLIELMERLDLATQQGRITWERTDRKLAFVYSTSSSSVIVHSRDDDGTAPFYLQILDAKGDVIESIGSHFQRNNRWLLSNGGRELIALYESARRKALGVDSAIDNLLTGLPALPANQFAEEEGAPLIDEE